MKKHLKSIINLFLNIELDQVQSELHKNQFASAKKSKWKEIVVNTLVDFHCYLKVILMHV